MAGLAADAAAAAPTVSISRNRVFDGAVWPADMNGDGITDLVGGMRDPLAPTDPPAIGVALGRGDGTFAAPLRSGVMGRVYGVSDFNGDGKRDVLAHVPGSDEDVLVVAGNGDGTLGASRVVTTSFDFYFAFTGDFDGDGVRDVAVVSTEETSGPDARAVWFYRGHGDLTFEPVTHYAIGPEPSDAIVADFNGDGRSDVAVSNRYAPDGVTVLLNQGAFGFASATVPISGGHATGVTSADVTGDGKRDLIVSVAAGGDGDTYFTSGAVQVLPGRGDGTFGAATTYAVERGAWRVVVGDFNRDGITDVATANRSAIVYDDCGPWRKTWDSLSILPGVSGGGFAARHSFSIGDQASNDVGQDSNVVSSLGTSDLNGDHATDLIVSGGTVFLNRPEDTNWAPVVNAGPDQTFTDTNEVLLNAVADDVDQDMLTYTWTTNAGIPIPPVPTPCISVPSYGTFWFTVTVDDGHGHRTSDTVTYTFTNPEAAQPSITITAPAAGAVLATGQPYTLKWNVYNPNSEVYEATPWFSSDGGAHYAPIEGCRHVPVPQGPNSSPTEITCRWQNPGPATAQARIVIVGNDDSDQTVAQSDPVAFTLRDAPGESPWPWQSQDIGAVGASGSTAYTDGVFTVTGSGADIWGTADEFQYAYRPTPIAMPGGGSANVEIVARVDSVQNVAAWTKAGLMLRQTLAANSPQASIFVSPGKGIAFQRRVSAGGSSVSTSGPLLTAPVWLRLTLIGVPSCNPGCTTNTIVRAYYRRSATDAWTLVGEQQYAGVNPDSFGYVGLAVSSHADGTRATAAFSSVAVRPLPEWTPATVGSATGTATLTDDAITVKATGADIWDTADAFEFVYNQAGNTVTARVASVSNTSAWAKAGVMIRDYLGADSAHVMVMVTPGKGIAMQYRATRGGVSAEAARVGGVAPMWVRLSRSGSTIVGSYSSDGTTWRTLGSVDVAMTGVPYIGMALTSHSTSSATATFDGISVMP